MVVCSKEESKKKESKIAVDSKKGRGTWPPMLPPELTPLYKYYGFPSISDFYPNQNSTSS
jgi:hypothetical protein